MTFIAASIFVDDPADAGGAIERAEQAASQGAKLVEWRVDRLAGNGAGIVAALQLVEESPVPCIVTCRHADERGQFDGLERERQDLVQEVLLSEHPPRYVDVELSAWRRDPRWSEWLNDAKSTQPEHHRTGLILSAHDFTARPRDLIQLVEQMTDEPLCDVIKVAWRARSLRDNLEAFDLLRERRKPMIALCMGSFGLMSRMLAPKFGGLLTFASIRDGFETAPGQPTVDELVNLYRFDSIGPATKVYGVIGWPVEHSQSPRLHNAAFRGVGHDGVYLPLPIPPEYEHFKATVGALVDHERLNFRGASVTIPHKEHLVRFVEERGGRIENLAQRIGAANTLIVGSAGGLECVNTDCPAAMAALGSAGVSPAAENAETPKRRNVEMGSTGVPPVSGRAGVPPAASPVNLRGKSVALLGAGGAARAIAVGLLDAGAHVTIFNRTKQRVLDLVESLKHTATIGAGPDEAPGTIIAGDLDDLHHTRFDIYINCTPTGMAHGPVPDDSPLPSDAPLDQHTIVFDTVYTPRETPLIRQAKAAGARVIHGEQMFLRQAAMQFERWTGKQIPRQIYGVAE